MRDDLELVKSAAVEAGAIAMRFFRRDPRVWWKEGNSPVSEADVAVDAFLKDALVGARPSYGWVSEEMERPEIREVEADRFFVVDPIDGTRAYLRGEDTWCVSIAVIEQGRPVIGVIAAPALGEVFEVTAGSITRLNGAACSVSRPGAGDRLRLAVPDGMRKRLDAAGGEPILAEKAVPSLAYRLALVASGRLDGTLIRPRANDWDIAAADLLIERAGGLLCDRGGAPGLYTSEGKRHGLLMAASHDAMARVRQLARAIPD
ncbi:3'(2'),5'-bisphosphate nucleotidase CysQ [Aurantimonas marina]|uniref:3'(2'),5'-bisphosphate nucleotidase CysQ n=1 Tax=Aurantimonas marina TaxID=2780508 RepID=UPI0019D055FC|nr:3'(2'),5'-bisphosphate nucleotidase CysQ [Aurantimonas marina]